MTELLLIRHALPVSGVQEPGLSEVGLEQARRLGSWLKGEDVDVIVTSPMRRAAETGQILAEQIGRLVDATVDDLREWDSGLPPETYVAVEEMGPLDPRAVALAEGRYDDFVPDLDRAAFRARVARVLDEVFSRWPVGRVAAVCHGGMLNAAIGGVLGVPTLFWCNPGYTSVSRLRRLPGGRTVVLSVNETAHLYASRD
ncbi:histidine phosphatase family protein [Aeromicrobium sp.]|uniref:histidine phosphatase family protein n=1 Tax=Aeromicrobium sp. TaxID=1871063 RepID=UPI0019939A9E|nr:histidine phosphatase family protein [Aeromicrobium sp.]MBC7632701.1 histidine phosphatase family protein [Aeromicrobium sp.]